MSKHSPLPWSCDYSTFKDDNTTVDYVLDANGRHVITTDSGFYIGTHGDMEFVVECVNQRDKLKAEIEKHINKVRVEIGRRTLLEAKLARMEEALRSAIEIAESAIIQQSYDDGTKSYFDTKWGWSEGIEKIKQALADSGKEGE